MIDSNFDQSLFTEVTPSEEVQVAGSFVYGFRMHVNRIQNVPVASVGVPATTSSGYGMRSSGGSGGGLHFDLQSYIFGMGAAYLFGNPGVTPAEVQYVWQMALRLH